MIRWRWPLVAGVVARAQRGDEGGEGKKDFSGPNSHENPVQNDNQVYLSICVTPLFLTFHANFLLCRTSS